MISRISVIIGNVAQESQKEFRRSLSDEVLPLIRRIPGLDQAYIHFVTEIETGAPDVYGFIVMQYRSAKDKETAMQSEERKQMQQRFRALGPLLDGGVYHIDSDVV